MRISDWSSDVYASDLGILWHPVAVAVGLAQIVGGFRHPLLRQRARAAAPSASRVAMVSSTTMRPAPSVRAGANPAGKTGRASLRARVGQAVVISRVYVSCKK